MSRLLISALLLAGLSACSTYPERVAATCSKFGAGPGTEHYWDCVQQQQEMDSRSQAAWLGVGAAMAVRPSTINVYGR